MYLGSASTPVLGPLILSSPSSSSSSSASSQLVARTTWIASNPGASQEPIDHSLEWLTGLFKHFWALFLSVVEAVVTWVERVGASLPIRIFEALCKAYTFVTAHPHPFHILGWSLFFGPIILLVPCLLLIELVVVVLFLLSFALHGVVPGGVGGVSVGGKVPFIAGSLPDRFDALREHFQEHRETLFARVEHWTAVFNAWTVNYPLLLVLRVVAGAGSLWILVGLWGEVPLAEVPETGV